MIWKTLPRSELVDGLWGHVAGSGPDLVLIHGVGLRAEAWGALIPLLSPYFTVHAVDMPGHGASPALASAGLDAYSARITAYIGMLGGAYVAGHSMGAMIAMDICGRSPSLVKGVAALNAIYRRTPDAAVAVQARAADLQAAGSHDPLPTLSRWFDNLQSPAAVACREWLLGADPKGYADAYGFFAHHDGPDDVLLKAMTCPAVFVTGALEKNSTPHMSQAMASIAPNAHAAIIEGAAHMAPMTHPGEIAAHIRSLLPEKDARIGH